MKSLRTDLHLHFILITILPLLGLTFLNLFSASASLKKQEILDSKNILASLVSTVQERIETHENFVDMIAYGARLRAQGEDEFLQGSSYLMGKLPSIAGFFTYSRRNGVGKHYPPSLVQENFVVPSNLDGLFDRGLFHWSHRQLMSQKHSPVVLLSTPLNNEILFVVIKLEELFRPIENLFMGGNSFYSILDGKGYYLAHSEPRLLSTESSPPYYSLVSSEISLGKSSLDIMVSGTIHSAYFYLLDSQNWIVGLYQDTSSAFNFILPVFGNAALIMGLCTFLGFILLHLFSKRIFKDLAILVRDKEYFFFEESHEKQERCFFQEHQKIQDQMFLFTTRIKQRESQREEQKAFLEKVINSLSTPFYVIDAKTYKIEMANEAGMNRPGIVGSYCHRAFWDEAQNCQEKGFICPVNEILKEKKDFHTEYNRMNSFGKNQTTTVHSYPIMDQQGQVSKIIQYHFDRSEEKRSQEKIAYTQKLLQQVLEVIDSVLFAVDKQGSILYYNQAFSRYFNLQENGQSLPHWSLLLKEQNLPYKEMEQSLVLGKPYKMTKTTNQKGEKRLDEIEMSPLMTSIFSGSVVKITDTTQQRLLAQMMVQSEKMITIGGLAAGLAHELNSPLAGILQSSELLKRRLQDSFPPEDNNQNFRDFLEEKKIPQLLDRIHQSGQRASDIIRGLLSFSRKDPGSMEKQFFEQVVDKALNLASSDYQLSNIYNFQELEIIKEYSSDLPAIYCDSGQIQQVILNILKNSLQAIGEKPEVKPLISLSLKKKKGGLLLKIQDNGPGMKEEIAEKIFEPFYSTKDSGQGTGLGMFVSYFIITENHHGKLEVISAPGEGCQFRIWLPLSLENLKQEDKN